jgi:hypothetical protein
VLYALTLAKTFRNPSTHHFWERSHATKTLQNPYVPSPGPIPPHVV